MIKKWQKEEFIRSANLRNSFFPNRGIGSKIKSWLQLSRLPFHLVGVLPFILGTMHAWRLYGKFSLPVFILSVIAVVLIMLATYYAGEYFDIKEDTISSKLERNAFSGGSQTIVKNLLPHHHAKIASLITLFLAGIVGLVIQFYYKTGIWTIPLGVIGMFCGFFYSTPPIRFVKRGVGEILIGFCYGWLPVATAFYLQTSRFDNIIHFISIPIATTIFNVIFINEFPDYPADFIEGKKNLLIRVGKEKGSFIYILMTILGWASFLLSLEAGFPKRAILFYIPFFLIGLISIILMLKKCYLHRKTLEIICGLTIVVNLGTSLSYILALF